MNRRTIAVLTLAVGMPGCAVIPASGGSAPSGETVRYELTPCFGACPVFSLTLEPDGTGLYQGGAFVADKGRHEFRATPAQLAAFRNRIDGARPKGTLQYDFDDCPGPMHTDAPAVVIDWGDMDRLNWNTGCRAPELVAREAALTQAWRELPVAQWVGESENRFDYGR